MILSPSVRSLLAAVLVLLLFPGCSVTEPLSDADEEPPLNEGGRIAVTPITCLEVFRLEDVSPEVTTFEFSSDGTVLYTYIGDGVLQLWNLDSGEMIDQEQIWSGARIYNASFSDDCSLFAGGLSENRIGVWDVASRSQTATLVGHSGFVMWIAFSNDGSMLASADLNGVVYLWDLDQLQEITHWQAHDDNIGSLTFSSDDGILASGGAEGSYDIKLWNIPEGTLLKTLQGHTDNVYGTCFTESNSRLLSVSGDCTTRFWNLSSGEEIVSETISTGRVYGLDLSNDHAEYLTSDNTGLVKVWDYEARECLATLEAPDQGVYKVGYSPAGFMFGARARSLSGSTGSIIVWRYEYDTSVPE